LSFGVWDAALQRRGCFHRLGARFLGFVRASDGSRGARHCDSPRWAGSASFPCMGTLTRRGIVAALAVAPSFAATKLPTLTITKDPTCDCCTAWTAHVRDEGFPVEVVETSELNRVKVRLGVPSELAACHTAEVDGYVIEGHVPASIIKRLIGERPNVKGVAVRGMPVGSPGMVVEGAKPETYDVIAFGPEGQSRYARFRGSKEL